MFFHAGELQVSTRKITYLRLDKVYENNLHDTPGAINEVIIHRFE